MVLRLNRTENDINSTERAKINDNWTKLEREYGNVVDLSNAANEAAFTALNDSRIAKDAAEAVDSKANDALAASNSALNVANGLSTTINNIDAKANEALSTANQSSGVADEALNTSNSVREELNQIVISGDSSVEAAQARVDENGVAFPNLKDRIDNGAIKAHEELLAAQEMLDMKIENITDVPNYDDNTMNKINFFIKNNHLGIKLTKSKVPGSENLIAGNMQRGYYGEVTTKDFGNIYMKDGTALPFDGINLTKSFNLQTDTGEPLYHETKWLKFAWKGKTLFYPKRSLWYQVSWKEIYDAGAMYGDDTVGFLPDSGFLGWKTNPLRINAANGQILGRGFLYEFPEERHTRKIFVGDKIRTAGWVNPGNNGVFTVTAITGNTITVAEKENLVDETGAIQTARFWNVAYEVPQNAIVQIEGNLYRVRCMKGGNFDVTIKGDGSTFAVDASGPINDNEYANLFLSLHEKAGTRTWDWSNYPEDGGFTDYVGITPDFGTHLSSRELGVRFNGNFDTPPEDHREGFGTHVWFMNASSHEDIAPNERLARGEDDGSHVHAHWTTAYSTNMGYRPLLELIGKA